MKQGPEREQESEQIKSRVKTLLKRCAPDILGDRVSVEEESTILAGILNDLLKAKTLDRWPNRFAYKIGQEIWLVGRTLVGGKFDEEKTIKASRAIPLPESPKEFLAIFETFLTDGSLPELIRERPEASSRDLYGQTREGNPYARTTRPESRYNPREEQQNEGRSKEEWEAAIRKSADIPNLEMLRSKLDESAYQYKSTMGLNIDKRMKEVFSKIIASSKDIGSLENIRRQIFESSFPYKSTANLDIDGRMRTIFSSLVEKSKDEKELEEIRDLMLKSSFEYKSTMNFTIDQRLNSLRRGH